MSNTAENLNQDEYTGTYSPEDNKLRLYAGGRLDKETYNRVRSAGFRWAPKQELFVAPKWTPSREDLLLKMCGEIGDEDTSLVDRAEIRAERFEDYSDKRANDAHAAKEGVQEITKHIPFGQPILVGHHSEKRARKDAEKIENGMKRAVKMWETSEYWQYRAEGALRHAKYKERPDVRARRIKKIEAAKRKEEKNIKEAEKHLKHWENVDNDSLIKAVNKETGESITTWERARIIANYFDTSYYSFPLKDYPREPPINQYEGDMSLWSALDGIITVEQAQAITTPRKKNIIAWATRWLRHYENRLTYEKAMLGEQGRLDLIKPKARPKQLPLLNYRAPEGLTVKNPKYYASETTHYSQVELTKAEYKKIPSGCKGGTCIDGTHRVKICMGAYILDKLETKTGIDKTNQRHTYFAVFLTDSKAHPRPEKPEPKPPEPPKAPRIRTQKYTPPERTEFDDMKDTLKAGVKTVSAPQLFPTPKELAGKMANLCDVSEGESVLEPSAGTGMLLGAIGCKWYETGGKAVAVELNQSLCRNLENEFPLTEIVRADFLECNGNLGKFDKIIMNPPFVNGADIKHIKHAITFLKPGGRLVALCADGPRQQAQLEPLADLWEPLPEGSFKAAGTNVNVTMLVIEA